MKPAKLRFLALAALALPCATAPVTGATETAAIAERQTIDAAVARVAAGEHLEAINVVEAAIDTIERRSSRYDTNLVRPLVVLGDALVGVGDTEGAFGAYDRALHIARVNNGLHHPSQVLVVYRQAALLAQGGEYAEANRRHEYAYGVLLRSYGGDSTELLPGLFVLADWYMTGYNIFSARALYEHAARVADARLADDHPAHIRALRSVASTYRSERFPPFYTRRSSQSSSLGSYTGFQYRPASGPSVNSFANGERALIKVINIIQARDGARGGRDGGGQENGQKSGQNEDLAWAMLELGDWFLMFEKYARAVSLYRRVWELLQDKPDLLARTFNAPTPLYMPLPRDPEKPDRAAEQDARKGIVELSVDVNEHGFVSNIDTLRSEPADMMDFKVRRAVKRARYRPIFDGESPQSTSDVHVRHTFTYYPEQQAAIPEKQAFYAAQEAAIGGGAD